MINVLFVCLGNICRSPSAEAVMNSLIEKNNLQNFIKCDSAGTSAYHTNEPADSRMIEHASKRNYNLTSRARQLVYKDLIEFDYIIAMDRTNYYTIIYLDEKKEFREKILLMTDYSIKMEVSEVPDPYYGGYKGFERVLDILEDACEGLLNKIRTEYNW